MDKVSELLNKIRSLEIVNTNNQLMNDLNNAEKYISNEKYLGICSGLCEVFSHVYLVVNVVNCLWKECILNSKSVKNLNDIFCIDYKKLNSEKDRIAKLWIQFLDSVTMNHDECAKSKKILKDIDIANSNDDIYDLKIKLFELSDAIMYRMYSPKLLKPIKDIFNYYMKEKSNLDAYCKLLGNIKKLYRGLKSSERHIGYVTDAKIFIPKRGGLNRFNPPYKNYIYLSFSKIQGCEKKIPVSKSGILNASELTCVKEMQARPNINKNISLLQFMPIPETKNLKILDLSFFEYSYGNGVLFNILSNMLEDYTYFKNNEDKFKNKICHWQAKKIPNLKFKIDEMIKNQILPNSKDGREYYKYISGMIFYILSQILFKPLTKKDIRWCSYLPFHMLAKYVEEDLKLGGIMYPSTRMMEENLKGYNLVLFNTKAVVPKKNRRIRHIYYGNDGFFEER